MGPSRGGRLGTRGQRARHRRAPLRGLPSRAGQHRLSRGANHPLRPPGALGGQAHHWGRAGPPRLDAQTG
eukprot:10907843-Lingulodinium_polyedra.AAC.1